MIGTTVFPNLRVRVLVAGGESRIGPELESQRAGLLALLSVAVQRDRTAS